jgi:hypothetical protein
MLKPSRLLLPFTPMDLIILADESILYCFYGNPFSHTNTLNTPMDLMYNLYQYILASYIVGVIHRLVRFYLISLTYHSII